MTPHPRKSRPGDDFTKRSDPRRFQVPEWLEERFGLIVVVTLLLVFGIPLQLYFSLVGGGPSHPPPTEANQQARLAVTLGPIKKFSPGSLTNLASLSVTIKNFGPADAINVIVNSSIGGAGLNLSGPSKLKRNEGATYTVNGAVEVPENARATVSFMCWNCPLSPGPALGDVGVAAWDKERAIKAGEITH